MEPGNNKAGNILLFGITGGTGKLIAENLLGRGYMVTGVARDPTQVNYRHPYLLIRKGDITRPETFADLVPHCDVIISAVADHSRMPTTLYSSGIEHILHTMNGSAARRLICISAYPVEISPAIPLWQKWLLKYVLQKIFKHSYKDLLVMEKQVRASRVNWTIIRPPWLKDKPPTGKYKVAINAHLKCSFNISRADLADYICGIIDTPKTFNSIIEIAY